MQGLYAACIEKLGVDIPVIGWAEEDGVDQEVIRERIEEAAGKMMAEKAEAFGPDTMRQVEKQVLLQTIDGKWREHLLTLEHLRSVVGFRGYAQRDPLNEYKNEAFQLFESMLDSLREQVTGQLAQIRPMTEEEQQALIQQMAQQQAAAQRSAQMAQPDAAAAAPSPTPEAAPQQAEAAVTIEGTATDVAELTPLIEGFDENDPNTWGNPGRNDPCPCGSGKKFKHCHGRLT